jgi:hypothetical protein
MPKQFVSFQSSLEGEELLRLADNTHQQDGGSAALPPADVAEDNVSRG